MENPGKIETAYYRTYYGWIPILSHTLNSEDRNIKDNNFLKVFSDTDPSQEVAIELKEFDESGFISEFEGAIPEKCFIDVSCEIKETGLVSFSFSSDPPIEGNREINHLAASIFDIIRDVYHEHVHHEKITDILLKPVESKEEREAVKKILRQYSTKIFTYHEDKGRKLRWWEKFCESRKRIDLLNSA